MVCCCCYVLLLNSRAFAKKSRFCWRLRRQGRCPGPKISGAAPCPCSRKKNAPRKVSPAKFYFACHCRGSSKHMLRGAHDARIVRRRAPIVRDRHRRVVLHAERARVEATLGGGRERAVPLQSGSLFETCQLQKRDLAHARTKCGWVDRKYPVFWQQTPGQWSELTLLLSRPPQILRWAPMT